MKRNHFLTMLSVMAGLLLFAGCGGSEEALPVTGITISQPTLSLVVDTEETLTAAVLPENAANKTMGWTSNHFAVATVDNGRVMAKAVGAATITVTAADGGYTATCVVTVTPTPVAVTGIALDPPALSLSVGSSQTITAVVEPVGATNKAVAWESSNTSVATVDNGVVTALTKGAATITATTADGGKTATCAVTVNVPVESIELNKKSLLMDIDATEQLTATVLPEEASDKTITWSTNNPTAAKVTNGLVTAVAEGGATITATSADGLVTAICYVTVRAPSLFGTVSFLTNKEWVVGSQTWSDVVMATGCKKDDYNGGSPSDTKYRIDCRQNEGYGDLFSWGAVVIYKDVLCPDGWRVPVIDDFCTLDVALSGADTCAYHYDNAASLANYTDPEKWNAQFGGYTPGTSVIGQGDYAHYWSQSENTETNVGLNLGLTRYPPSTYPSYGSVKYYGLQLRCVKDN